jgi:hypothetical protein
MDTFDKGIEDIERLPTLTVDSLPFDTTPLTEITIKVFHNKMLDLIGTYTLSGATVEKVAPNANGQIRFVVTSEQTAVAKRGKYLYQIHTLEPDATFPDNVRERSFIGWCFRLKGSV